MTSPATDPPARASNEATTDQLTVARREGDAYADALYAMADEDGAVVTRAGDYLIAFVNEEAEGMYERDGDRLVWREAAPEATTHLEVAVADGTDGRFVPGLTVHTDVELDDGPRSRGNTSRARSGAAVAYGCGSARRSIQDAVCCRRLCPGTVRTGSVRARRLRCPKLICVHKA